jgi:hypothetical protein
MTIAAALVLMAGVAGAQQSPSASEATVGNAINYQGRLTNPGGQPLSGSFPMRFQVYDDPGGGVLWSDSGILPVDVDHGFFNVELLVDPAAFNGQGLWLRIYVHGEWLSPRQALLPVPYALSLRPGASIQDVPTESTDGWVLNVGMDGAYPLASALRGTVATGTAVYGNATGGFGLRGYTEEGYAVYGHDQGVNTARGYGGHFSSDNGVGVYGYSGGQSYMSNMYAPGVYGRSANGAGVYGVGEASDEPGYGGFFEGRIGVGARSIGTWAEDGYAGHFDSANYRGIYAHSQSGYYDGYFPGVGGIWSAGGYSGMAADQTLAVNGGGEPLEPGNVVAIAGVVESPQGGEVLLAVRKADAANSKAVVGVVAQAMQAEMKEVEGVETLDVQAVEGSIPPRGHLTIITHGLAPVVKVEAAGPALEVGDLLTIGAAPGSTRLAEGGVESNGLILGKVAGPVDAKTGTVPVFIVLR